MFPPLPFSLPEVSVLSFLRPLLPFVPVVVFVANFAFREHFYEFLEQSLNTGSKAFRIIGEILGLADASVKSWGLYFLYTLYTLVVSPPQTIPLGLFVGFCTMILLGARYWVYPAAVRSINTRSPIDDVVFIGDITIRALGVYQLLVVQQLLVR